MEEVEEVVIAGAGIAGLATAVALKRVGIRAVVLERSEELRATGNGILLFQNAGLALDALGVSHKLNALYPPLIKGFLTTVDNGSTQEFASSVSRQGTANRGVHRKALLEVLAGELPVNTIRFSSKVTSIELQKVEGLSLVAVLMEDGTTIKAKVLIGCDGVNSVVARWLGLKAPVNSGRSAVRGLAVFPKGHGIKQQESQQFVYAGTRAGILPLNDKELHWFFIYKPNSKDECMDANPEMMQRQVIENYAKNFPSAYLEIVRHTDLSTLTWTPLTLRVPWDLIFGNVCKGAITVAGDAMHPMTPDLGQGAAAALEEAVILGRHIGESFIREEGRLVPQEASRAIERYAKERRWRSAWLITGSFLTGWMQQLGSGWYVKFIRDVIFYKFLYRRMTNVMHFDCGKLPKVSYSTEVLENKPEIN